MQTQTERGEIERGVWGYRMREKKRGSGRKKGGGDGVSE